MTTTNTGSVTDMVGMFSGCSGLTSLDLSGLDTGSVTSMKWMFYGCNGLTSLDLSGLDTGSVTDMSWMFYGCSGLTSLDLSGLDTGSVTDMVGMFSGCSGLTSLDLSGLDTGSVTSMKWMFYGYSGLTSLDLSGFDTRSVADMSWMFYGCSCLTSLDLSGLDTGSVTSMKWMFYGCSSLTSLNMSGFHMRNVKKFDEMFSSCDALAMLQTPASLPKDEILLTGTFYVNQGEYKETTCLTPEFADMTLQRKETTDQPEPTAEPAPTDAPVPTDAPAPTNAPAHMQWTKDENGREFWYENGVRQGYRPDDPSYRGREIYDPASDAWYWLDNVQQGAKAVSKDVYQESGAGLWAEGGDGTGKWVRYDAEGHMVKGWNANKDGTYYFDLTYGTMAKGTVTIDGSQYHFDEVSGILTGGHEGGKSGSWKSENGTQYWYEGGVRQGYDPRDNSCRGKEIYDPASDAWYWLDNVQQGAKAVSKDVYQESAAGDWAENADGTGKWVRYDAEGHMVKGWNTNERGTYYFDLTYGTMAKGNVVINGKEYYFDQATGILKE